MMATTNTKTKNIKLHHPSTVVYARSQEKQRAKGNGKHLQQTPGFKDYKAKGQKRAEARSAPRQRTQHQATGGCAGWQRRAKGEKLAKGEISPNAGAHDTVAALVGKGAQKERNSPKASPTAQTQPNRGTRQPTDASTYETG